MKELPSMRLKSIKNVGLRGKKVLLHVDYNTPLKKINGQLTVSDATRIRLTLPTIQYLLQKQAKIIILSHAGRPNGRTVPELRLDPMAKKLQQLINHRVNKLDQTTGPKVKKFIDNMKPGDIVMLENVRFHPGQTKNDPHYAKAIAKLGDLMINDGFPVSHRAHSSIAGVAKYLPIYAGFQLMLEVKMLGKLMTNPRRPFIAVVGGAKVSDKVDAIKALAKLADAVLVGGGVANNFLAAEGINILNSYLQDNVVDEKKRGVNYVEFAGNLLKNYRSRNILLEGYIPIPKIVYPLDVIAATDMKSPKSTTRIKLINNNHTNVHLSEKLMFLDIGPSTIKLYKNIINKAKVIFWNGPMGVFEEPHFTQGTKSVAKAIAATDGVRILGGGDTIAAIRQYQLENKYDFISSAGGASLEFLAGKTLPGIKPMLVK